MIGKKDFLKKYRIEENEFESLKLNWSTLVAIAEHHQKHHSDLIITASDIVGRLTNCPEVHSLRSRIKQPEHLLEKIIRKRKENPDRDITLENYASEITDLVGVRALHLFKGDWLKIHGEIMRTWDMADGHKPLAFVREAVEGQGFVDAGCELEVHKRGYRSVHYVVKCQPTKLRTLAEIQVRTIFEEGWSEVDHRMAYPCRAGSTSIHRRSPRRSFRSSPVGRNAKGVHTKVC